MENVGGQDARRQGETMDEPKIVIAARPNALNRSPDAGDRRGRGW
jgi:hypothetical protein